MLNKLNNPFVKKGLPVVGAVVSAFLLGPLHLVTLGCVGVGVALHFLVK
jgi:hypothetical protein